MSLSPVRGYTNLRIHCEVYADRYSVAYTGTREDLIASGVATAEMLDSIGVKGLRGGRRDMEGRRYWLQRQYVTRNGVPVRWYRLRWRGTISRAEALRMPGALAAAAQWQEMQRCAGELPDESLEALRPRQAVNAPARGGLRLIVDNTRR